MFIEPWNFFDNSAFAYLTWLKFRFEFVFVFYVMETTENKLYNKIFFTNGKYCFMLGIDSFWWNFQNSNISLTYVW